MAMAGSDSTHSHSPASDSFLTRRRVLVWTRIAGYSLVIALAAAAIGISTYLEYIQHWKGLAVYLLPFVVGIVTIVIVLPMTILDRLRQDAAIHQPRVELVWCGLIMLAWLASSMFFTIKMRGWPSCSVYRGRFFPESYDSQETWCRLHIALQALLWVGWAILLFLVLGIFLFGVYNTEKGYGHVWETSIPDFERPSTSGRQPVSEFHQDRLQARREVDAAMAEFQQRYEASLAESTPSLLPIQQPRASSPTRSVRSAVSAIRNNFGASGSGNGGVGHHAKRTTSSDHLGVSTSGNGHSPQGSSNSLLPGGSQRQLDTIVDAPESSPTATTSPGKGRVYGSAV